MKIQCSQIKSDLLYKFLLTLKRRLTISFFRSKSLCFTAVDHTCSQFGCGEKSWKESLKFHFYIHDGNIKFKLQITRTENFSSQNISILFSIFCFEFDFYLKVIEIQLKHARIEIFQQVSITKTTTFISKCNQSMLEKIKSIKIRMFMTFPLPFRSLLLPHFSHFLRIHHLRNRHFSFFKLPFSVKVSVSITLNPFHLQNSQDSLSSIIKFSNFSQSSQLWAQFPCEIQWSWNFSNLTQSFIFQLFLEVATIVAICK